MRHLIAVALVVFSCVLIVANANAAKVGGRVSCNYSWGGESNWQRVTGLDVIAAGRTQVDVLLSSNAGAPDSYSISVSDLSGAPLASASGTLAETYDGSALVPITGLPSSGGFRVTVTGTSTYAACTTVTWDVRRTVGVKATRWIKVHHILFGHVEGYALTTSAKDLLQLIYDRDRLNMGEAPVKTSCQNLKIAPVTATITTQGVLGSQARTARFADQCELAPGQKHSTGPKVLGTKTWFGTWGYTIRPVYRKGGSQTYRMGGRIGTTAIRPLIGKTSFTPSHRIWEGTDEYFNYCITNLFGVGIIMEGGHRYCVSPAFRDNW